MRLVDVNVLIYANRVDADRHSEYREWLLRLVNGDESYAVSDFVVNGYVRIVTNARIYKRPTDLDAALNFAGLVRNREQAVVISPGERHWELFARLCRQAKARGKLVPDAYLAALAIEHGCEFVTTDRDFSNFPGLRWRHPLN